MLDSDDPFKGIADDLEELSLLSPDLLSPGTGAEDLVDFDVETCVSHQSSTDAEIIAWATGKQGDEEEDEGETIEVEDEPIPRPSFGQMISAIELVRRYSLFTDDKTFDWGGISDKMESLVRTENLKSKKQKLVHDFFQ